MELSPLMELPILPLRTMVLFPHAALPMTMSRRAASQAVAAAGLDGLVAVVTQAHDVELPGGGDLFAVGTGAVVRQLSEGGDTTMVILEGLEQQDGELADEVRNRMFVFEDVQNLDDRSIQLVLRAVDAKELSVALKGVDQKVRNKVMKNMSERAAANLAEEIQLLGPIKLKTVEEAQNGIVRIIRTLEESGQIDMARGSDELVV